MKRAGLLHWFRNITGPAPTPSPQIDGWYTIGTAISSLKVAFSFNYTSSGPTLSAPSVRDQLKKG